MPDLIDLHVHTTCSDGSHTPREVVDLARRQQLAAIAITDHDTIGGNAEAISYGADMGLEVIPGVEISVDAQYGSFHILGYFIDYTHPGLVGMLSEVRDFRDNRNPKIITKLNGLGVDITLEEVAAEAGGGVVGRPHMARVMVARGYVKDTQEAFDRYLKTGAAAHVDKRRVSKEEGIRIIRDAGGVAVWAHPGFIQWPSDAEMEAELKNLMAMGLEGIEAYYSTYSPRITRRMVELAGANGLLVTGGTDFHGESKRDIALGFGRGDLAVGYEHLDALKARAART